MCNVNVNTSSSSACDDNCEQLAGWAGTAIGGSQAVTYEVVIIAETLRNTACLVCLGVGHLGSVCDIETGIYRPREALLK